MYLSFIRSILVSGAIVPLSLVLGSPARASSPIELPAQLRNEPRDDDANGSCSLCRVNSLKAANDVAGSEATLELYLEDERSPLSGSLQLTVLLHGGMYRTVRIDDVTLAWHQITVLELEPGDGWDWGRDVEHVWVELVPISG